MREYRLVYTNGKGKSIVKMLKSYEDLKKWANKLDKRIENGTCGGYIITSV